MQIFFISSGLSDSIERSAPTSFSIFPRSRRRFWWIFIQAFCFPSSFIGEQPTSHLPKMLAGVVEIDNLRGARKVQADKIPNPFGAVANHDLLECTTPATSPSFGIDSPAKLFRTLDGSGIRGGIGIADGIAFLIPLRLGEDASQFYFPSMGRLARARCRAERMAISVASRSRRPVLRRSSNTTRKNSSTSRVIS